MNRKRISTINSFLFLLFIWSTLSCTGQNSSVNEKKIYDVNEVDAVPVFPGDGEALNRYLNKNVKWVTDFDVSGKVYLSFIVKDDGAISDIKIEKGLCDKCDEEAIRVVKTFPHWKPGEINGNKVNTRVMISVPFKLIN